MTENLFVIGGYQTDFSRNYTKEGLGLFDLFAECVQGGLQSSGVDAAEIEVAHIGNFAGEMFSRQGQMGGFLGHVDPALAGIPASRHEAACASGSLALLAAGADIEAGRYDLALVVGVELMRNVPGVAAAQNLGAAAWVGNEATGTDFTWPYLFSSLADEYDRRYGLKREHLAAISENAFANARQNPLSQTRKWEIASGATSDNDALNPVIEGRMRRSDCGQITDGAACVLLASKRYAERYCERHGRSLASLAQIKGWGHRTDYLSLDAKLSASKNASHIFPVARSAMLDALCRAGMDSIYQCDGLEVHDCFSITQYMIMDHFGVTAPGESWKAIEDGTITRSGRLPINPSGGLIGLGHPVGASGVRMVLDASRQVTDTAGDSQIGGARNFATFNLGGSATTSVSFIIGR